MQDTPPAIFHVHLHTSSCCIPQHAWPHIKRPYDTVSRAISHYHPRVLLGFYMPYTASFTKVGGWFITVPFTVSDAGQS